MRLQVAVGVWKMLGLGEACCVLARQSSDRVPRLFSTRKDGLKSDALNGSQGYCLRTGRVQEELSYPVPPTLGGEVWEPVSMLQQTREHI